MPRYRQRIAGRARAGWPTRSGSTTQHFDLGYHVRRSALPRPGSPTSSASWSPGSSPARSTGTGRCGRSTSSRGSSDGRVALLSKSPPGARRRRATPSTSARCCSTARPSRGRSAHDDWRPRRRRRRPGWSLDAVARLRDRPGHRASTRSAPTPDVGRCGPPTPRPRGPSGVAGALTGRRPAGEHRAQRPALPAAPVRHRPHRRSPTTARSATAHGGTVNDVILATVDRRPARLADDPRRVDERARARSGPWCRSRSSTTSSRPPRSAARSPRTSSTCRSARPARWCGCTRCPTPSRPTRRPAAAVAANRLAGHRRLRADDVPRASARGSRPTRLRRGFQLSVTNVPGPAVPAVRRGRADGRDLPGARRCCPATPLAIGVTSYDGQRLLRHHRRPRPGARRRPARPVPARGARRAARHDSAADAARRAAPRGQEAPQARPRRQSRDRASTCRPRCAELAAAYADAGRCRRTRTPMRRRRARPRRTSTPR